MATLSVLLRQLTNLVFFASPLRGSQGSASRCRLSFSLDRYSSQAFFVGIFPLSQKFVRIFSLASRDSQKLFRPRVQRRGLCKRSRHSTLSITQMSDECSINSSGTSKSYSCAGWSTHVYHKSLFWIIQNSRSLSPESFLLNENGCLFHAQTRKSAMCYRCKPFTQR